MAYNDHNDRTVRKWDDERSKRKKNALKKASIYICMSAIVCGASAVQIKNKHIKYKCAYVNVSMLVAFSLLLYELSSFIIFKMQKSINTQTVTHTHTHAHTFWVHGERERERERERAPSVERRASIDTNLKKNRKKRREEKSNEEQISF